MAAKSKVPPLATSKLVSRPISSSSSPSKLTPRHLTDDEITPRSRKTPNPKSDDPTLNYELEDLRNEIRHKNGEIADFTKEIMTLKRTIATKDDTIEEMKERLDAADERLLQNEGQLDALNRQLTKLEEDHRKMEDQMKFAVAEADRMNKLMLSHTGNSAKALSEASQDIARLQSELAQARQEIERLTEDNKGCYKQIRAKDRAIEVQAAKVAQAEEVLSRQMEEHNQVLALRRQLAEAQEAIRGSDAMQALCGQEAINAIKGHKKATSDLESSKRLMARLKADVEAAQGMLKQSQARVGDLEGEITRLKAQADRTKKKDSRKFNSPIISNFHEDEITRAKDEVKRLTDQLAGAREEVILMREHKDNLLNRLDDLAIEFENAGGAPDSSMYETMLNELRVELLDLRHDLATKVADCAALEHACEASAASCAMERVKVQALRVRLAETMEPLEYEAEFNRAPPSIEDVAQLEVEAKEWGITATNAAKSWAKIKNKAAELKANAMAKERAIRVKKQMRAKESKKNSPRPALKEQGSRALDQAGANDSQQQQAPTFEQNEGSIPSPPSPDHVQSHVLSFDSNSDGSEDGNNAEAKTELEESLEASAAVVQRLITEETNRLNPKGCMMTHEAMAKRLEEMNNLSLMVSSLKARVNEREGSFARREEELVREIALLRASMSGKKGPKPPKSAFKKVITGISKSFNATPQHK